MTLPRGASGVSCVVRKVDQTYSLVKKKTDAEILPAHKSPYVWKKNEKHIFQPLSGRVYANSQERIRYYYIDIVNMFFGGISTILFLGPEKFTRPLADQGYLGDGSKTMIYSGFFPLK
jgi:hypothetical protein